MSGASIPSHIPTYQSDDPTGRRAIEVAAMLGDSVVAVSHLTNPHGGRVTHFTRGLFVVGALGLVNAAIAVAHGVSAAARNQVP
jgi:hypothetical protein